MCVLKRAAGCSVWLSLTGITLTFPLQEGPHKGVNAHKLQLNVITVKGDPLAIGELLNRDAILLR